MRGVGEIEHRIRREHSERLGNKSIVLERLRVAGRGMTDLAVTTAEEERAGNGRAEASLPHKVNEVEASEAIGEGREDGESGFGEPFGLLEKEDRVTVMQRMSTHTSVGL